MRYTIANALVDYTAKKERERKTGSKQKVLERERERVNVYTRGIAETSESNIPTYQRDTTRDKTIFSSRGTREYNVTRSSGAETEGARDFERWAKLQMRRKTARPKERYTNAYVW